MADSSKGALGFSSTELRPLPESDRAIVAGLLLRHTEREAGVN